MTTAQKFWAFVAPFLLGIPAVVLGLIVFGLIFNMRAIRTSRFRRAVLEGLHI